MPSNKSTAYRNATADARTAFIGGSAKLVLETSGGTPLAIFTCATPNAPASANGVRSPTLPAATTFSADGTVARASLYKSDGTTLIERYTAGTSGAEVIVSTTTAVNGAAVAVINWTCTEPS
jgi:hypothetical protein